MTRERGFTRSRITSPSCLALDIGFAFIEHESQFNCLFARREPAQSLRGFDAKLSAVQGLDDFRTSTALDPVYPSGPISGC